MLTLQQGRERLAVSNTYPGILSTIGKDTVVQSNVRAVKRRSQAIHGELIKLDNLLGALRQIMFDRGGFNAAKLADKRA